MRGQQRQGSISFEHKTGTTHRPGTKRDPENRYHKGCEGRWAGTISRGTGKNRARIRVTGRTLTECEENLKSRAAELDLAPKVSSSYTVDNCLDDWIAGTLVRRGRAAKTVIAATSGLVGLRPLIGDTPLRKLTATDLEEALEEYAEGRSSSVVSRTHQYVKRAIRYAMAHQKVGQNVALLIDPPAGKSAGRPSKAFSRAQAIAVLRASKGTRLDFYIHLSILHGMRTEEARALGWDNVDDFHEPDCGIDIVEADRVNRRTKTESSKRGTTLCQLAVESGVRHKVQQAEMRLRAGIRWQDHDLVFATQTGGPLRAGQVRFMFRNILRTVPKEFGIVPGEWTPRDMRHTFVALMSDAGVRIEDIQREMGHDRQSTTESVYWHELKPRRSDAAKAMNEYMGETGVAGA